MAANRLHRQAVRHCRCTVRACQKRFKGVPGSTCCPACAKPGRLDTWAAAKPWRANTCHCDAYKFPHRLHGGDCVRPLNYPALPGVAGLPF